MGNVPTEASFWATGSFPSSQLGCIPIDFFKPSIGLLTRQICQKYDIQPAFNRVGSYVCTDWPPPTHPTLLDSRRSTALAPLPADQSSADPRIRHESQNSPARNRSGAQTESANAPENSHQRILARQSALADCPNSRQAIGASRWPEPGEGPLLESAAVGRIPVQDAKEART